MLDFGVEAKKVMAFIHDNGANIGLAARTLEAEQGWYSLGCAGHTLQLYVNAGLKIISSIDCAIGAVQCLVSHFRKSEPAMGAFRNHQKAMQTPNHCLIQDGSTR